MKLNKNKGNLQNQLAKMLQAGMENVEQETAQQGAQETQKQTSQEVQQQGEQESPQKEIEETLHQEVQGEQELHASIQEDNGELHANTQANNNQIAKEQEVSSKEEPVKHSSTKRYIRNIGSFQRPQTARRNTRSGRSASSKRNEENEERALNAAQRHEVPDRNTKYAGEPIKSVGCRMPVSLYARMLQYKALNDSQLNRITLNDIIIEAVEKFMEESK